MSETERQKRLATRRSCFYSQAVQKGETITEDDIEYRRPGYGIPPKEAKRIIGSRLRQDCPEGRQIEWTDLE